jgi:hypothetical protein
MAALASLLPGFLRRKRSAEEEEAYELRAALNAAGSAAAVDACIELRAANRALKQRVDVLERAVAASDDAAQQAMRDTVRDELARATKVPRLTAEADCVPPSAADDPVRDAATGVNDRETKVRLLDSK